MKTLLVLLLVLVCAFEAGADITVVQTMQSAQPAGFPPITQTIYVRKHRAKIDLQTAYLLIDLQQDKKLLVLPARKELSIMGPGKWHASGNLEQITKLKPTVTKTGKTKTINGYRCEQYIWSMTMRNSVRWFVDYWVTADVDPKEFEPFIPFTHMDFELPNIEDLRVIEGFPIRTEMSFVGHGRDRVGYTTEVQKVTHSPIPDSVFSHPKSYKLIESKRREK